nr:MAG TPA: hypothetical protein [Caudoviricetes sp.]
MPIFRLKRPRSGDTASHRGIFFIALLQLAASWTVQSSL